MSNNTSNTINIENIENKNNVIIEKKKKKKKKKNKKTKRCQYENCNKRLSLTDYISICKCEKYFCILHKSASNHNCTFNYRAEYMEKQDDIICDMKIVNKKMEVF